MNHLHELNEAQKRAVRHKNGPILIIAGAGAGKTLVLTHRILHLIKEGVPSEKILAVTFTNKAAKEMRERISKMLREEPALNLPVSLEALRAPFPFVSTFHSLGVHILREHAKLLGLKRHFNIFDRNDSMRATREAMKRVGINDKEFEPKKILGKISRTKGAGISVTQFSEQVGNDFFERTVLSVWEQYEKILSEENSLDFDDLLLRTLSLLEEHIPIRKQYQDTWKYILVDEYQDTNRVQYRISELLAGKEQNICVVGDIDQNIYSWRGAEIENLLNFEKTYPHAKTVLLEENYRSTQNILGASNAVIEKNKNRVEKKLFTQKGEGEKITLAGTYDEGAEAHYISQKIKALAQKGVGYKNIAILYRTNFQSRILEEVLLYEDVPYQILGTKFFERKEVKDALSYLKAALNPESIADIKRVVDAPPRGIGKVTLFRMIEGREHELPLAMKKRVADFRELLASINKFSVTHKPSETMRYILARSGLEAHLKMGKGTREENFERLQNLYELVTLAGKYDNMVPLDGIEKLLEDAALATEQDTLQENHEAVKLMTIHASKGLEFDYVFISGLEEGLFPQRYDDTRDGEEERRLFYVALTRARKKVFLTFASARTIFGSKEASLPSEFIDDIPREYLEDEDTAAQTKGEELLIIE